MIDEMRGSLRHPPSIAGPTDAASFAGAVPTGPGLHVSVCFGEEDGLAPAGYAAFFQAPDSITAVSSVAC